MNRFPVLIILIFSLQYVAAGHEPAAQDYLNMGMTELRNGRNEQAARYFREVPYGSGTIYKDALYWLVKTDTVLGDFAEAARFAERFIQRYPDDERYPEILYHRARLFHLLERHETAVTALDQFISDYPASSFIASAYYWKGEALMAQNLLDEADAVFAGLLERYPSSVKREAAYYRRSELALMKQQHREHQEPQPQYQAAPALLQPSAAPAVSDHSLNQTRLLDAKDRLLKLKTFYVEELLRQSDAF